MKYCILILHFKNSGLTSRCIASALRCSEDYSVDVVVIDATHDFKENGDLVARGSYTVIRTPQINPGFSRSMNFGADKSVGLFDPDAFVFVNNDAVLPPDYIRHTDEAFGASKEIGAVGPKIVFLDRPDLIWSAGGYVSRFKMRATQVNGKKLSRNITGTFETKFLSGCVVAIRATSFNAVNGWPAQYLFGGEEWEISERLRGEGCKLVVASASVVLHEANIDSGQGRSHSFEKLEFVINGYLNRKMFARYAVNRLGRVLFNIRLFLYIRFIMPFLWGNVSGVTDTHGKLRLCKHLSSFIYRWDDSRIESFDQLKQWSRQIVDSANKSQ